MDTTTRPGTTGGSPVAADEGRSHADRQLAERVRRACIEAALAAHEDGGISGLCHEGRWELAMQAIRCLDLGPVLAAPGEDDPPGA